MKKATLTFISLIVLAITGPLFAADAPHMEHAEGAATMTVNINKASAQELADGLTGVGEGRAMAIIEYREEHGPFQSAEALMEVSGIGEATLQANAAHIEL